MAVALATANGRLDAEMVKAAAIGRQLDILIDVAGIDRDLLDGKHHPCPQCDGVDRFRLVNKETGAVFCNQCLNEKCGDFIAAVMWAQGLDFTTALHRIGEYLGISSSNGSAAQPFDLLAEFSRRKHIKPDCLTRYGATLARRGPDDVLRIPMVDQNGVETGHQDYGLSGALAKGMTGAGSKAGLFIPGRLPRPAEKVVIVEGVKDAAALAELGFFAIGTPGTVFKPTWPRAFKGCQVILIPDRDKASYKHFGKVAGLLDRVAGSVGRVDLPFPMAETGGKDCRDLLQQPDGEKTLRDLIDQAGAGDAPEPFKVRAITAAELDGIEFEINYLIDGILADKQPCLVGGKQKTLKTSILLDMAVSLTTAGHFLGRFPVPMAQQVGIISCESGMPVIQETLRRICRSYGTRLGNLAGLVVSDSIPRLGDPSHADAIGEFCLDNELTVLMLDPAYLMMDGADAGNLLLMGARLRVLNEIATQAGVTIVLAHHLRKNRPSDLNRFAPPDLEEIAWSGFAEFARQWLLLGRRSEYEDGSGFHDLWLRAGGSAGHSGLYGLDIAEGRPMDEGGRKWDVAVQSGKELVQELQNSRENQKAEKQQQKDEAGQNAVVEAMSSNLARGEGAFEFTLRKMTGIGDVRLARLLFQLEQKGIVEQCRALKSPTHKAPQDGAYRLTEDWWSDD